MNKELTKQDILNTLDLSNDGYYSHFVRLEDPYSYLIDVRLNIFRDNNNRWAIVVERLGYNPRAEAIILDIFYYGNCLADLETYNNRKLNYYQIFLIGNLKESTTKDALKSNTSFWTVRDQKVSINYTKQDYFDAGIEFKEYNQNELRIEDVVRVVVFKNRDLFRATDNELYKSIPKDLEKILVLDEWYHKDFYLDILPVMTKEQLKQTYEFNKKLTGLNDISFDEFVNSYKKQSVINNDWNKEMWDKNRPSTYETWQQIAKVIVTNNPELYKPTIKPNTHWKNWLDSGNM